jgi:hypothetical protein
MPISLQSAQHHAAAAATKVTHQPLSTSFSPLRGINVSCSLDVHSHTAKVEVDVLGNKVVNSTIGKDHPCVSANLNVGDASGNLQICIDVNARVVTVEGPASVLETLVQVPRTAILHF